MGEKAGVEISWSPDYSSEGEPYLGEWLDDDVVAALFARAKAERRTVGNMAAYLLAEGLGLLEHQRPTVIDGGTKIGRLGLSSRAHGAMKKAGIEYVEQLVTKRPIDLLRLPGLGRTTFREIVETLAERGLALQEDE